MGQHVMLFHDQCIQELKTLYNVFEIKRINKPGDFVNKNRNVNMWPEYSVNFYIEIQSVSDYSNCN